MNPSVLEIIVLMFFGVLFFLVLCCELICIKRIRRVESMLQLVCPLIGHEKTTLADNLQYSLEAIKEINNLFARQAQPDKRQEKRVLN